MSTMIERQPVTAAAVTERVGMGVDALARYAVPAGRMLFSLIFLKSLQAHLSPGVIQYAGQAGVPFAEVLVPLSGLMAFAGGLSVLLGYRTRIGAALLVLFLVPVTLTLHAFWAVPDPMAAQLEMAMFMKNVGLMGGALILFGLGAGPLSLDALRQRRAS